MRRWRRMVLLGYQTHTRRSMDDDFIVTAFVIIDKTMAALGQSIESQ